MVEAPQLTAEGMSRSWMLCEDRCWRELWRAAVSAVSRPAEAPQSIRYNKSLNLNPKRVAYPGDTNIWEAVGRSSLAHRKHLNLRVCGGTSTYPPIKEDLVHIFTRVGGTTCLKSRCSGLAYWVYIEIPWIKCLILLSLHFCISGDMLPF